MGPGEGDLEKVGTHRERGTVEISLWKVPQCCSGPSSQAAFCRDTDVADSEHLLCAVPHLGAGPPGHTSLWWVSVAAASAGQIFEALFDVQSL